MNICANGLALLQFSEQCRLTAYPDSRGRPTIGWGHTAGVKLGMTCTQAEADQWLVEDLGWAVAAVNRLVTAHLTQNQFDALVVLVYNIGETGFATSTPLIETNRGNFYEAAEGFRLWENVAHQHCLGLENRREREIALFEAPDGAAWDPTRQTRARKAPPKAS